MMRNFVKFTTGLLGGFAILLLTACASAPTEGVVLTKDYTPAHEEIYQVSVDTYDYGCRYVSNYDYEGNYSSDYECGFYYGDHGEKEDRVRNIPDKWTVSFEGKDSDGETQRRTVEVSEAKYDEAKAGYYISVEDNIVIISQR